MRQNEGGSPAYSISGSSEKLLQSGGVEQGPVGEGEVNVCDFSKGGVDAVEHLSLHGDTRSKVF